MPDAGLPRFLADLSSWYAMESLAVGHALGLREALLQAPGTADQIAGRAGADERVTETWLAAMVSAGYATHADGVFAVDPEHVPFLAGTLSPGPDTVALLEFVLEMNARLPAVVEALRAGSAPDPDLFGNEFGRAVAKVNAPLYAAVLVPDWLAADAELTEALTSGCTLVDFACGNGGAVGLMAEAFPNSTFVGVDRDERNLEIARNGAPGNASFSPSLPPSFDAVTIFDSFHHFSDPDGVLANVREGLAPGGVLVIAESAFAGDFDADTATPFGVIRAGAALLYCDVEGRTAAGSAQISARDGGVALREALASAGFTTVTSHEGAGGFRVWFAR